MQNSDVVEKLESFKRNNFYWIVWAGNLQAVKFVRSTRSHGDANNSWQSKYGCAMPPEMDWQPAETLPAYPELYDGTMSFGKGEADRLRDYSSRSDFTMEMAWHVFDFLKWRPFVPVPLINRGWKSVIDEDRRCYGYFDIVWELLSMPEKSFDEICEIKGSLQAAL